MDENVFNFIYVAAMRDAVLQKAYEGEKKELYKLSTFDGLYECIRKFTDKVLTGGFKEQDEYNNEFLETTKQICVTINEKLENKKMPNSSWFAFGNAQKLLNIMLKYFYIICYEERWNRDYFRFCHCPMDQEMLEKVWEACKSCKQKKPCRRCSQRDICQYVLRTIPEMQCFETKGSFTESWGQEDFKNDGGYPDRYLSFQAAVKVLAEKDKLYPIEYDYRVWGN